MAKKVVGKKKKEEEKKRRRKTTESCCSYRSKDIILPLLATLADLKSSHRTFVLAHLDEKTLRTLCEAVDKVLHAKLPSIIKNNLKKGLLSSKDCLRRLCQHKKLSCTSVRNNLLKMGGGPLKLVFKSAIPLYSPN